MDNCSLDLTTGGGCEYQIAANPAATYAPSQFDQAHRVVVAGAYELPFGAVLNHGGIANSGRDLLRGPGFWDFDVSVNKKFIFPIGSESRCHLDFRADFYNAFNHPNFAQPNATVGSAATGTITATAYSNPNNNPSRQIQLGLVFKF